ncbi:hypothetical protein AC1031_004753 [Aphanomyces cochlioides]|nr:hypothetical protein AC1031_004753 [Aphanomyces cochlioides]
MNLSPDKSRWRCRSSNHGFVELSVKAGTFFSKSKLPMRKLVRIMFDWASRKSISTVMEEQEVSDKTASEWFQRCRQVCTNEMSKTTIQGGGTQHPDCLPFGGVDRTTKKWFGVLTFQDRTKPTLTALIKKHIRPGTMIMSDKFGSYVSANGRYNLSNDPNLSDMNYGHMWDKQENVTTAPGTVLEQAYKPIRTTPPEPIDLEMSAKLQAYVDKNFPTETEKNIQRRTIILGALRRIFRAWVKDVCIQRGVLEEIANEAGGIILVSGSYRLGLNEPLQWGSHATN